MTVYFMNTSLIPSNFEGMVRVKKSTTEVIKNLINKINVISAIGHQSTADLMSMLLEKHIEMHRLTIKAEIGDIFICFQTANRLEEGKIYTFAELQQIIYVWKILEFFDF